MNTEDEKRDYIVRFLYERHKQTKGIHKIPIGIRDLQAEMKSRHEMKQQDVSSNLDYLVQVGWVREIVRERSFKTSRGMEVSQEQVKYKISEVGINHLEAGTVFKKPESIRQVNITNVKGVTVVGDGNVVNASFTDLSRLLNDLDRAIANAPDISDEQKLDAAGDITTIQSQIAKKSPDRGIIQSAWKSLERIAAVGSVAELGVRVGQWLIDFWK